MFCRKLRLGISSCGGGGKPVECVRDEAEVNCPGDRVFKPGPGPGGWCRLAAVTTVKRQPTTCIVDTKIVAPRTAEDRVLQPILTGVESSHQGLRTCKRQGKTMNRLVDEVQNVSFWSDSVLFGC